MDVKKPNKSQQIREFFDAGLSIAEIAKLMGIRYQFAYNVVSYYVMQKQMEVAKHVAAGLSDDSSLRVADSEGSQEG